MTITVAPGTYAEHDTITATTLHSLTIEGAGSSLTTVTGTTNGRPFTVTGGTVTISGIQVSKGYAATGAAVSNAAHATLTLTGDTFANNDNDYYDYYGSVYNAGTLTATNDTFTASSGYYGGGIANLNGGNATVTNDTFADDNGYVYGGGVSNWGTATVTDDTFANDTSVYHYGSLNGFSGTLTVSNSILDGAACSGTITDGGHNVASDDSCAFGPDEPQHKQHPQPGRHTGVQRLDRARDPGHRANKLGLRRGPGHSLHAEHRRARRPAAGSDEPDPLRRRGLRAPRGPAGHLDHEGGTLSGPSAGGTTVTITGLNLLGTSAVHFGTTTAASFTVVGSTEITATTEPHRTGRSPSRSATPRRRTPTPTPSISVTSTTPAVNAVTPPFGPTSGGETVSIHGTNFLDATTRLMSRESSSAQLTLPALRLQALQRSPP